MISKSTKLASGVVVGFQVLVAALGSGRTSFAQDAPTAQAKTSNLPSDPGLYLKLNSGFRRLIPEVVVLGKDDTSGHTFAVPYFGSAVAKNTEAEQVPGLHAPIVTTQEPVFYFVPSKVETDAGVSAANVVLISMQLDPAGGNRYFLTSTSKANTQVGGRNIAIGSAGGKVGAAAAGAAVGESGSSQRSSGLIQTTQVTRDEPAAGVYSITPAEPLKLGEYALHTVGDVDNGLFYICAFSVPADPLLTSGAILIQNDSEDSDADRQAQNSVESWGRFKVVKEADEAQLVFVITGRSGHLRLAVKDAKSGRILWGQLAQAQGGSGSASKLVQDFKGSLDSFDPTNSSRAAVANSDSADRGSPIPSSGSHGSAHLAQPEESAADSKIAAGAKPRPAPVPKAVLRNVADGERYVLIPPGTFLMGCSPGDQNCAKDELPARSVTIAAAFRVAETPVTVAAFRQYTDATGEPMPLAPSFDKHWSDANAPIVNVTWGTATKFCGWAGGRLLTEAEWEYAARAQTVTSTYAEVDEIAWFEGNSDGRTHAVAKKKPNAFGLYDMLGNVWEWVQDSNAPTLTLGPVGPANEALAVARGGSWSSSAPFVRASSRLSIDPGTGRSGIGFRCGESMESSKTASADQ